ncbi:MAG TPA: ATP-binding protein [Ruminococcus sp.]|nr:ATP-binding protein [Ruminococcus sp.]
MFKDDIFGKTIAEDLNKQIWKKINKAIKDYQLIEDDDRIAVCISGGKDSMLMAKCIQRLQSFGKPDFQAEYIVMDPGYAPANRKKIEDNARLMDIPVSFYETSIFESAESSGSNPCFLCARLRRGFLYKKAQELSCNKIALGHHFDDVIETILMGMLYGSQMQTMLPKLHSENYEGVQLIRPLYLVREEDIITWTRMNSLSFIDCACRMTEKRSDDEHSSKRHEIKMLLKQLRRTNPAVDMNIFRSAENVNLRKLISYHDGDKKHHFLDDYDKGITVKGTINQKYKNE